MRQGRGKNSGNGCKLQLYLQFAHGDARTHTQVFYYVWPVCAWRPVIRFNSRRRTENSYASPLKRKKRRRTAVWAKRDKTPGGAFGRSFYVYKISYRCEGGEMSASTHSVSTRPPRALATATAGTAGLKTKKYPRLIKRCNAGGNRLFLLFLYSQTVRLLLLSRNIPRGGGGGSLQ